MTNVYTPSLFSSDGQYFAYCSPDGCLKVWDSSSGCLRQEYTPSTHLSSLSACIAWGPSSNIYSPSRKKTKKSVVDNTIKTMADLTLIAMGTLSGDILVYSVTKACLHSRLSPGHSDVVNDVCWQAETDSLFSCSGDQHIIQWKLSSGIVYEKWKADKEPLYSICLLDEKSIISASSNSIKWWDVEKKTVLKKFSGHGKEIFRLLPINRGMTNSISQYFISAAVGDRIISAWSLKNDGDCNAVASFTLPDDPRSINVTNTSSKEQPIRISVITKKGDLHIFEHQLNGRCKTPLLPKLTLCIATGAVADGKPQPVPLLASRISHTGEQCQIAYGSFLIPVFETIELDGCQKDIYLIRKEVFSRQSEALRTSAHMVREPNRDGVIQRLAPGFMTPAKPTEIAMKKRRRGASITEQLPMEERLNALYLEKSHKVKDSKSKSDSSVIHLLLQGLQSQDPKLLNTALECKKEDIIGNSLKRLPLSSIPLLLKELHKRLNKKVHRNQPSLKWMKILLQTHLPYLMTCQDIDETLGPVSQLLDARLKIFHKMLQVNSHLDSFLCRVSPAYEESFVNCQALVTCRDDSSEEEGDDDEEEVEMRTSDQEEQSWDGYHCTFEETKNKKI